MKLDIQLHENDNQFRYELCQGETLMASLEGSYHGQGRLANVFQWEGRVEDQEIESALVGRVYADCLHNGREVIIHLTERRQPIFAAFSRAGFLLGYESLVFRHELLDIRMPRRDLRLLPADTLPAAAWATLFWQCNHGDPRHKPKEGETPAAFFDRFCAEIDDLHVPEWMFVAFDADAPVGILLLRVTEGYGKRVGFMNYVGMHPDFRGRGLGADLHLQGLHWLQAQGCDCYIGSTDTRNVAMQGIFAKNEVALWSRQVFLKTNPDA